jgi:hypothetical protein
MKRRLCCGVGVCLQSGDIFYVDAFGRDLASVVIKMASRLIYFIKKLYTSTFNAICKDNAAFLFNIKRVYPTKFDWSRAKLNPFIVNVLVAVNSGVFADVQLKPLSYL